jgi:hypothetical protein
MQDEEIEKNKYPDLSRNPEQVSAKDWLDKEIVAKLEEMGEKHGAYNRARLSFLKVSDEVKALKKTYGLANKKISQEELLERWGSFIESSFSLNDNDDPLYSPTDSHDYYEYLVREFIDIEFSRGNLRPGRENREKIQIDMGIKPIDFGRSPRGLSANMLTRKNTRLKTGILNKANSFSKDRTLAMLAEEVLKENRLGLKTVELKQKIIDKGRPVETNTLITAMNRASSKFQKNEYKKWVLRPTSDDI